MKSRWIGKRAQGRPTWQSCFHHLLVDIIPTLLLLLAMAFGMALVSSKLAAKPLTSDVNSQVQKVS